MMLNEVRRKPEKPRIWFDGRMWQACIPTPTGSAEWWASHSLKYLYEKATAIQNPAQ